LFAHAPNPESENKEKAAKQKRSKKERDEGENPINNPDRRNEKQSEGKMKNRFRRQGASQDGSELERSHCWEEKNEVAKKGGKTSKPKEDPYHKSPVP